MRIVFMGTPDFAVPSLKILIENNYNVVGVITAPDKPAGRGLQSRISPIKKFAIERELDILQPEKLKSESFINELKSLNADLQVVVAFRMLPEVVWSMPPLGTFNLHASLLPQYRGAAPINWAIINGEKETGATTFFLQQQIDTGKIIFRDKIAIRNDETAGELHDELMVTGANLVLKTVKAIEQKNYTLQEQPIGNNLKTAPKIFTETCKIDFKKPVNTIYNLIRGLSPYPAAFTFFQDKILKIYKANKIEQPHSNLVGEIITDNKTFFRIAASNGFIEIEELQLEGKKRMNVIDFLNGLRGKN
jgi:methionyl-tRNA formyltransferase